MTRAIVVGSGPNGLAAAARLAAAGVEVTVLEAADEVGGGMRSQVRDGLTYDHCSAFHPLGIASPFLSRLPLAEHGLRWRWSGAACAHPLDDGTAGVLYQDLARTASGLGADAAAWQRLFGPVVRSLDPLLAELLQTPLHRPEPSALLPMARFGPRALAPASLLARLFGTEQGKGLFGGLAAHLFGRLDRPVSAAVGLMLGAVGHEYGWPVAEGGSGAIAKALTGYLEAHGGSVRTGVPVTSRRQLDQADLVLLDTSPETAARLYGDLMPGRVRRAFTSVRRDSSAYKVDLTVEGEIPWTAPGCAEAGTVHLGGSIAEIAASEAEVVAGRMPRRPFVLLGQQWLADPTRTRDGLRPVYAYAHVPFRYDESAARDAVVAQIERFAPGFGARIRDVEVSGAAELEAGNANLVGGDITGGSAAGTRLLFRPRPAADPYALGVPGVYLCSASTPPGAGVHGMGGANAAARALRRRGIPIVV